MHTPAQIAKHFREVHTGGNWTFVNLKDTIKDITWQQATTPIHGCNTIATLVYHVNYYVHEVLKVLRGNVLEASDKYSFSAPAIESQAEWEALCAQALADAEAFAELVEQIPDEQLDTIFVHEKYGTWYRNLHGIIEHTHYHLGQISLLKKMVQQPAANA